jgi:hypothetical protein
MGQVGVGSQFIEPGSLWENGRVESFNGKFRAEFPNRELFDTLPEARSWSSAADLSTTRSGNTVRSAIGRRRSRLLSRRLLCE